VDEIDRAALPGVAVHPARDLVQVVADARNCERQAGDGLGILRDAIARFGARLRRLAQRKVAEPGGDRDLSGAVLDRLDLGRAQPDFLADVPGVRASIANDRHAASLGWGSKGRAQP
jgi:hypothetical protein